MEGAAMMKALTREVSRIDLQEGNLYKQHYDQRKELGRGKFGVVYHVKVTTTCSGWNDV